MRYLAALALICLAAACAYGSDAIVSQKGDWGELHLVAGLSHLYYWPSGNDGKNAEMMAQGKYQASKYMTDHPGDWCVALLRPADEVKVVLDSATSISLVFPDKSKACSDCILAMDTPLETRVWSATDCLLVFEAHTMKYAPSFNWLGSYVLYVRFPENSCLSTKGDGRTRKFKTKPIAVEIQGIREVRQSEEGTR